jgi:hypothetical protein
MVQVIFRNLLTKPIIRDVLFEGNYIEALAFFDLELEKKKAEFGPITVIHDHKDTTHKSIEVCWEHQRLILMNWVWSKADKERLLWTSNI